MARARLSSASGVTLLEAAVAIAILTAITALAMPTLAGMTSVDNELATRSQAELIHRAIYGDPTKGDFGYIGDMGRLPTTLTELVEQGSQTGWHTADGGVDHIGKVGTGWRGPYLRDFFSTSELLTDAWGLPFTFSGGRVTSGGPDGDTATTGDNIVYPVYQPASTGTVHVSVLLNRIPDPLGATVKLYYTSNGEQTSTATTKHLTTSTNFDGFTLEAVPHGIQVVRVQHTAATGTNVCVTVTRWVPIAVYAGQQVVRDVRMTTAADVKVTENPCTIPD